MWYLVNAITVCRVLKWLLTNFFLYILEGLLYPFSHLNNILDQPLATLPISPGATPGEPPFGNDLLTQGHLGCLIGGITQKFDNPVIVLKGGAMQVVLPFMNRGFSALYYERNLGLFQFQVNSSFFEMLAKGLW